MDTFVTKHADAVTGTLSGFDWLVFRGTLRVLCKRGGTDDVSVGDAGTAGGFRRACPTIDPATEGGFAVTCPADWPPVKILRSVASDKEAIARGIAQADGITQGLICVLTAVEPCWSYEIVRDHANKRLGAEPRYRKCLHLYHYQIHPRFGFMSARIQTWLPFRIKICLNGREWLSRSMDAEGLGYLQRDNCFTCLEQPERAQQLMDQQLQSAWPALLTAAIARSLNPQHEAMFAAFPVEYYWSTYQNEWATDLMFRNPAVLARLYPRLVHHGLTTFFSPDVMRFLGRRAPPDGGLPRRLEAEVVSDVKRRPEGVRIKHCVGQNSLKIYAKQGSVLRVETTINDVDQFKTFRAPENKLDAAPSWQRMRKGVADLHRRAEVSQASNDRYPTALASVERTTPLAELTARLCRPVTYKGRRVRAINPHAPDDTALLTAISRGESTLNGLRNRDLCGLLFPRPGHTNAERKRQAAAVSRKLRLLRAHHLIRKVSRTHRYHLTDAGRTIVTALSTARNANTQDLTRMAC